MLFYVPEAYRLFGCANYKLSCPLIYCDAFLHLYFHHHLSVLLNCGNAEASHFKALPTTAGQTPFWRIFLKNNNGAVAGLFGGTWPEGFRLDSLPIAKSVYHNS
jgi:hypothetical protein